MSGARAPWWLRPVHRWFFWWEDLVPSLYRVIAVAVGAALTAVILRVAGVPLWIGVPLALPVWIGLAIAQEHDERVMLPVDPVFLGHLRELVDPVLGARGFVFNNATGPCRARPDRDEVFLYVASESDDDWAYVQIERDVEARRMWVAVDGRPLAALLVMSGFEVLSERAGRVVDSESDARAIREGLVSLPDDRWP